MFYTLILVRKAFLNFIFNSFAWLESWWWSEKQASEKVIDENNNNTTIDELFKKVFEDGKVDIEDQKVFLAIQDEAARIDALTWDDKNTIQEIAKEARKTYSNQIKESQQNSLDQKQERIAANDVNEWVKDYNKHYLSKAENLVNYASNNPDFKNKWLTIAIEDGKVQLYSASGDKLKYFTIPVMGEDGKINTYDNNNRLDSNDFWFKDFVQAHVPEVKTYAEIWKETVENKKEKERVADVSEWAKDYNKHYLSKAENLVNYASNNPDFKNKWLTIAIEDGKVQLYSASGDKLKYFTIPVMGEDGKINTYDNNNRLDSNDFWFKDFVQAHVPEVKTYAEIWKETVENKKEKERVADVNKEMKEFNKNWINQIWINIKKSWNLPDWVSVAINSDTSNVEIKHNNKVVASFQPMLKDSNWNLTNEENKNMYIPNQFHKWVKENTDKFV